MIRGITTISPANRLKRVLSAPLAVACLWPVATPAQAQAVSATANSQAVVVASLSLVSNQTMNFGRIAPSAAGGTVALNPDTNVCTVTGTIVRVGACQPAEFSGMGVRRMRVRITLPTTITLTRAGGGATMLVNNIVLDPTPDLVPIGNGNSRRWEIQPNNGIFDFRVGGTLNVGANQLGGTYNGTFVVTVQYQ